MTINLQETGIDPRDPAFAVLLSNLQGNILKPHGREHVYLLLLQFAADLTAVSKWFLHLVSSGLITSAAMQYKQTQAFREGRGAGSPFGSFFMSAQGYRTLKVPDAMMPRLFLEGSPDLKTVLFREGMAKAGGELNDPAQNQWEAPYQDRIDAMLLLADDNAERLEELRVQVVAKAGADGAASVVGLESGHTLRNDAGEPIEHFGYADGISQPLFLSADLAHARLHNDTSAWDPAAPLSLVLVADPLAPADSFGSYLVFRKLEQDLHGFNRAKADLASELTGADPSLAGAFAVGRFEDGTPVMRSGKALGTETNNFNYGSDPLGNRCPLHAHIRKTNPRGGTVSEKTTFAQERMHRIARRGIPYDGGMTKKGLLFMCYQRDISRHFGFLQKLWANNPAFPSSGIGIDPLIGQSSGSVPPQSWPPSWGAAGTKVPFDFKGFVTLKGGEFFFAPSLPFLADAIAGLRAAGAPVPS